MPIILSLKINLKLKTIQLKANKAILKTNSNKRINFKLIIKMIKQQLYLMVLKDRQDQKELKYLEVKNKEQVIYFKLSKAIARMLIK